METLSNRCALVVNDEPTNLLLLEALMEAFGFSHLSATQGEEALKLLEQYHGKEPVSVIVTDLQMPIMDGRTFITRLRTDPNFQAFSQVPVFVMTATRPELIGDLPEGIRVIPTPLRLDEVSACFRSAGVSVG